MKRPWMKYFANDMHRPVQPNKIRGEYGMMVNRDLAMNYIGFFVAWEGNLYLLPHDFRLKCVVFKERFQGKINRRNRLRSQQTGMSRRVFVAKFFEKVV